MTGPRLTGSLQSEYRGPAAKLALARMLIAHIVIFVFIIVVGCFVSFVPGGCLLPSPGFKPAGLEGHTVPPAKPAPRAGRYS